ncbi:hypothetical protein BS50DRAFT_581131 [Corynespora cassiicola Philippines]|uniref:Rhodopsin domain-containing protein n=1 Tax=Corynespora cassiicola Philippines TaxID=1448308 RepID=A0A2T2P9I9_CORCC|nr:hypothetical protein BS50DRAFT_581131 [Corynespora cassiicola Philippines]
MSLPGYTHDLSQAIVPRDVSKPNYKALRSAQGSTLALASVFLFLRIFNRNRTDYGAGDWIILATFPLVIIITALSIRQYDHGYGSHETLPESDDIAVGKLGIAIFTMFPIINSLIRLSIVFGYLKLFPAETNREFCFLATVSQIIFMIISFFMTLFQCDPLRGYWEHNIGATCIHPMSQDILFLIFNALSDLIIYLWPIQYLWKINRRVLSRVGLCFSFGAGAFNVTLSGARLYMLVRMYKTRDWSKYGVWGCLLIILEIHFGIMCNCLPFVREIFKYAYIFVYEKVANVVKTVSPFSSEARNSPPPSDMVRMVCLDRAERRRPRLERDMSISTFNDDEDDEEPEEMVERQIRWSKMQSVRNSIRRLSASFDKN